MNNRHTGGPNRTTYLERKEQRETVERETERRRALGLGLFKTPDMEDMLLPIFQRQNEQRKKLPINEEEHEVVIHNKPALSDCLTYSLSNFSIETTKTSNETVDTNIDIVSTHNNQAFNW